MTATPRRSLRVVHHTATLGNALRLHRLQDSMTQAELAHKLGVRQQTIGAWERGEKPQARFYGPLAAYLELPDDTHVRAMIDGDYAPATAVALGSRQAMTADDAERHETLTRLVNGIADRAAHGPLTPDEVALFRELITLCGGKPATRPGR